MKRRATETRKQLWPGLPGLVAVLVGWGIIFLLLWSKALNRTSAGISTALGNVWGDWAAHFTYASVFALREPADWLISHPVYKGVKFTYPFLTDLISGLLMRAGVDSVAAFIVPSVVFTFALLGALYAFYFMVLRSSKQAFLAVSLNLLTGGLGFLWFIQDFLERPGLTTVIFPPREYTHLTTHGIEWISIITSHLVPQRAYLLGLPVVLLLIMTLHKLVTSKKEVDDAVFIVLGFFSSLLLFVHVHSFIAFVFFCAAYAMVYYKKWRTWFVFAASAGICSALIFSAMYGGQVHAGFFKFYPGWLANPKSNDINWLYFWWLNWGWFLPFSLFAAWRTKFYRHPLYIGSVIIFVMGNLFLFQPFAWDNSKLFSFAYLVFCIPTVKYVALLWRKKVALTRVFVVASVIIMTLSATLDLTRALTMKTSNILWSAEDIQLAKQFETVSEPTDTVLVSDMHNHWVPSLTGRQILLGYRGWLWTYGIDYSEREREVRTMFAGGPDAEELLSKYEVRFIVIGPSERQKFTVNEAYFEAMYPVVVSSAQYAVYERY